MHIKKINSIMDGQSFFANSLNSPNFFTTKLFYYMVNAEYYCSTIKQGCKAHIKFELSGDCQSLLVTKIEEARYDSHYFVTI